MKGFFDTSALGPVFYGDRVHHRASLALLIQLDKSTGCPGAHSLAEVYSTLTWIPGKHRIGGIRERLSILALSGDEYAGALETSAALGIVGGGIYDAMLANCAIKANAEAIYTWDGRRYAQCGFGSKEAAPSAIDARKLVRRGGTTWPAHAGRRPRHDSALHGPEEMHLLHANHVGIDRR